MHGFVARALCGGVVAAMLLLALASTAHAVETTITSAPPAASNSSSATFEFTSDTSGATFQCKLDAEAFATCASPHTISALAEGARSFSVRALGSTGGPDPTPATHNWSVDYGAPETVLDTSPPAATNSTTATFEFSSPDSSAGFQCSLNGGAWGSCASPLTYSGLSEGTRSFSVRAVDPASNLDTTPPSVTWSIDLTPPETTIVTAPPPVSNSDYFYLGTTEVGTFECSINGGIFKPCAAAPSFDALPQGSVTLAARATDAVGNIEPTPATHTWIYDTVPPPKPDVWVGPRPKKTVPKLKRRDRRRGAARRSGAQPQTKQKIQRKSKPKHKIPKLTKAFQTTSKLELRWGGSGNAVYDIFVRRAVLGGENLSYKVYREGAKAGRQNVYVRPGERVCFTVDARDPAGNKSSKTRCVGVPYRAIDQYLGGWAKRFNGAYFHGQYVKPTAPPAQNRIVGQFYDPWNDPYAPGVVARKVYLVLTRCPDCERIRVAISSWECDYMQGVDFQDTECDEKTIGLKLFKVKASKTKRTQFLRVFKFDSKRSIYRIYVNALGKAKVEGFAFK